ncbi:LytR/AlgR family response regulator transcription factor [Taibaiella koreensis]|uniref:LytR/AlgR family response regulator transcription factor n=1 Tax=Taibaiella koreensis TaxID=1268548 RepID=UPI000E59D8F2|nr:LytTR family DNA-binding domain-containing protein [Taibaiella koreensis]
MRILIIEDEVPAYSRLSKLIQEMAPLADIAEQLDSVAATRSWLAVNSVPDVVFMDIHLADGSAFDLMESVRLDCPIIFTTAYDQYAIDAFRVSSVDYLLKPVKREDLQRAFAKLKQFRDMFKTGSPQAVAAAPGSRQEYKKRFLIRFGEHIKTLNVEEISYFFSENRATFARNHDGRNLPVDYNLDALEAMLDPSRFFRINRQFLISLEAISEMKTYSKARVIVTLKPQATEQPVVSSERSAHFKQWLAGEL